jgi:hypothetical protein
MAIELFELHDNVMLVGGIAASMPDYRNRAAHRVLHVAGRI